MVSATLESDADSLDVAERVGDGSDAPSDRPEASRLGSDHVWDVREGWGDKAKEWGQGVKVFKRSRQ